MAKAPGTFAAYISRDHAVDFLDNLDQLGCNAHCEHGHLGCSHTDEGPCLDEVLANFPDLAE